MTPTDDKFMQQLIQLQPRANVEQLGRLQFAVGMARGRRSMFFWQSVAAIQFLMLLSAGAGIAWMLSHPPEPSVIIVQTDTIPVVHSEPKIEPLEVVTPPRIEPKPSYSAPKPLPPIARRDVPVESQRWNYWQVRNNVLEAGLSMIPETPRQPRVEVNRAELERSLRLSPGVLASPYYRNESDKKSRFLDGF